MTELPLFESADGGTQALWQRRDMIVARLHEECALCAALERDLRAAISRVPEAGVAVIRQERGEQLDAALGRSGAYLAIANRFLQLYEVLEAHVATVDQALGWLEYVQKSCGECQPPFELTRSP